MGFSGESISIGLPATSFSGWIDQIIFLGEAYPLEGSGSATVSWDFSGSVSKPTFTSPFNLGWVARLSIPLAEIDAGNQTGHILSSSLGVPKIKIRSIVSKRIYLNGKAKLPSLSAFSFTQADWGSTSLSAKLLEIESIAVQEVLDVFESWCMNIRNYGTTEFKEFNPTSVARIGGKYYGTFNDGIYLLSGDKDVLSSINAVVTMGIEEYSGSEKDREQDIESRKKQTHGVYLNLRCDATFAVSVKVDEQKERVFFISSFDSKEGVHQKRVKIARGISGVNWQFGFKNVDGSDFLITSFKNLPVVLRRRI